MVYIDYMESFLGPIRIEADDDHLLGVSLAPTMGEMEPNPITMVTRHWLRSYFAGKAPEWVPPLRFPTPFLASVSEAVMEIPFGQRATYSDIARAVGRPRGYQAVGQALSRNPYMIIVPCHRVVGKRGVGGYGYGVEVKRKLLEFENAHR
ncbi:MAG: methylated-DNA--[protein]-cysteine S-methyltransferase [Epsilonproteobacteria bacterium]|nr:methylated-DNA--[protein]-cysteine S-methyltransferase [Campylobacterota bacterium]